MVNLYSVFMISRVQFLAAFLLLPFINSCHDGPSRVVPEQERNQKHAARISILEPLSGTRFTENEKVTIKAVADTGSMGCDSLHLLQGNILLANGKGPSIIHTWHAGNTRFGKNRLYLRSFKNGTITGSAQVMIIILPAAPPSEIKAEVVRKYPHDSLAYTQGLYYEDGFLYESTGQYRRSSLRKVALTTGEIQQSLNLPDDVFGEGLAVFDGKILQLSWKNKMGFLYDKNTFQLLKKVQYPIDEGWGLTWDGHFLWMSNGSEILYKMDPETFSETGEIEVYDNQGAVSQLNELEYIDGRIFANVYGKDFIVVIDPETGRVERKIDLGWLIPERYKGNYDKVLNGIAWNPSNGHLFVTGKEWPYIYEVRLSSQLK